jgi:hypothetical protein
MPDPREQAILKLVEEARKKSYAFIVLGILPGDRFFYSCDERITLPDLHGQLENIGDAVCESVSRTRARNAKERRQS